MNKVKNRKIITRISMRSMIARQSRNLIAVLAIALTSLLFTSLFTIGGNMIEKSQLSTMRQVGGSAHAGYKYLLWDEYEQVIADPAVQDPSYRIAVADAENKELLKLRTEISYYEEQDARYSFCYPEVGHLPVEKYELCTSDLVLKALGVPCEIGQKVPLKFTVHGKTYELEFTLSGWFKGDRICMSQIACVSRELADGVAPAPTVSANDAGVNADDYAGRVMVDFNFKSSWNLEKQVDELSERLGFENISSGVNWAYMSSSVDMETVLLCAVMLVIIFTSGYLIIYNIFYINVYSDIRFYGLLKTIGTTGKQLRSIVRRQAFLLSAAGIPIGLVLGFFAGKFLFPVVTGDLNMGETFSSDIHVNPWIFLGAALFSLLTVLISCIRPCAVASRVSPVEAVRYTEGAEGNSGKKKRQKGRRTRKITMRSFAMANIRRNRKKVVIVVLSLSISLILLNSIFSMVASFDMDKYISMRIVSDFGVADATVDNVSVSVFSKVLDGVKKEFLEELEARPGIKETGSVYYSDYYPEFSHEEYERFRERIWSRKEEFFAWQLSLGGEEAEGIDWMEENNYLDAKAYGLDQLPFEKMEIRSGEPDWEKFRTGKYVITNSFRMVGPEADGDYKADYYDVGEKVTLKNDAGESREYEVMAVGNLPYASELQSYGLFDCTYFLPVEEFSWLCGARQPMRTLFNVEPDQVESTQQWLEEYCENTDPDLTFSSKESVLKEFESFRNMISTVGILLSGVLALIGILNFINTMVTSILSRRREFAMIEATGMTGRQLQEMLMWEGGYYAIFTVAAAAIVCSILNLTLLRRLSDTFFFVTWKFTIQPVLLSVPVIVLVVLLVPVLAYRKMCTASVVERIRVTE